MGQIIRCPLTGVPCSKPITIQEKTFFLAEAEEPDYDKQRRRKAISEAIADGYKIRSALEEKGINAFTCKMCEMIQACAYGMADISQNNANVFLELGMMLALGKPTIILLKKGQERQLKLPSDVIAIEIIPFEEYLDIVDQLREVIVKLPSPISPPTPLQDLEKIRPQLAEELKKMGADIAKEFKESVEEAKLDTISLREEKKDVPPELDERLRKLEKKLEDMTRLGFTTDARTAFLRGNFYSNQKKYNEALTAYSWSLELNPDHPVTLSRRGLTYIKLERYKDALADYNRALAIKPNDFLALASRGLTYIELERYKDALTDSNHCLQIKPDDPVALSFRGIAYRKLERYEEALADFNHCLQIKPDDTLALDGRGNTYARLKRYNDALADFNHCLQIKPDDPSTLYNLACLFSLWGKTDDALRYLEKAIGLDKKYREKAKKDEDLNNIREDSRFKKLMESD